MDSFDALTLARMQFAFTVSAHITNPPAAATAVSTSSSSPRWARTSLAFQAATTGGTGGSGGG